MVGTIEPSLSRWGEPAKLSDEAGRLAALGRYAIVDTPPEPAFDKITKLVCMVLEVPISVVSLIDTDRQLFKSRQGLDIESTPRDVAFCHHTIGSRGPMFVQDARFDPRFHDNPLVRGQPGIVAYAGVPLETPDGYNIGALCAIDRVARAFDPGQLMMLASFAQLVVGELELRQAAGLDVLTGALTRRALVTEIDAAIAARDRHQRPSALLVFDIDRFKALNDRYGHPAGDAVLKAVVGRCRSVLRPGDALGRIGGEEFAALLPETSPSQALDLAERLRAAVATTPAGAVCPVTASFGIAPLASAVASAEDWLARADEPLYAAKHAGRNTCRVRSAVSLVG